MTTTGLNWAAHARQLADLLWDRGDIETPEWHAAITGVPRHAFVPRAYEQDNTGQWTGWETAAHWDRVYAPKTLVTALESRRGYPEPVSSSTNPELMARMLEILDVRDDHRVLEIGTGTGYHTALLAHRLGDHAVYSVDLDPALVDSARGHLAEIGRHPQLAAGDGAQGWPDGGSFDRIIATCAITAIPPAWIDQLADGGRIVAPLDAGSAGPLLVLDKTADDEVTGIIDPYPVLFMPMRTHVDTPYGPNQGPASAPAGIPHYGTTTVDPAALLAHREFTLFMWLHAPGLRLGGGAEHGMVVAERGPARAEVDLKPLADGTWAVRQHGTYRLWDTVEHAVAAFDALDRPDATRLGVIALNVPGKQYVWLDDPDSHHCWPLAD